MITGKENIIKILRLNNAPYFRISKGENGAVAYQNDLDGNKSINDGIQDLEDVLNLISPGTYHLRYYREKTQGSKFMSTAITINGNSENNHVNGFQQFQPQPVIDVEKAVSDALIKYQTEQELKELKAKIILLEKENKELEKQNSDRLTGIISSVAPYLAPHAAKFVNGLIPIPTAETSEKQAEFNGTADELKQQIIQAFNDWDEEPETVLRALQILGKMHKENDPNYIILKNMLLNQ